MTVKRFEVFDTNPIATAQAKARRERGEMVFLCGRSQPKKLGEVEATNAANALMQARDQWPDVSVRQMWARPVIEEAGSTNGGRA